MRKLFRLWRIVDDVSALSDRLSTLDVRSSLHHSILIGRVRELEDELMRLRTEIGLHVDPPEVLE